MLSEKFEPVSPFAALSADQDSCLLAADLIGFQLIATRLDVREKLRRNGFVEAKSAKAKSTEPETVRMERSA